MRPEQSARIATWITEHWKHGPCPVCASTNFRFGEDLIPLVPVADPNSGLAAGRGSYMAVQIICFTCGYTILLNASIAKIWIAGEGSVPDRYQ